MHDSVTKPGQILPRHIRITKANVDWNAIGGFADDH